MNYSQTGCKKTIAVTGALFLCGSVGFAQMAPNAGGAAHQVPGQNASQNPGQNPALDPRINGMQVPGQSLLDKMFVKKAMQGSMAEVQLGQLTLQTSQNEQVKQFAQRMIDDHTKLNDQMKSVAQQLGVDPLTQVSKKDKGVMGKLQALSGPAYDQAYIKDMVKDHKQNLSEFQIEASSGKDQTVKDMANQGSKVIAQHLQMAQQMARDESLTTASKQP